MCACVFKCVCMPVCICMCEEKKQRVGTDIEGELWDWQQERDERCAVVILEDCFGPVMYECESFWEARSQVCLLTGTFGIILVEIHSEIMGDLCVGQRTQSLLPHQKKLTKPNNMVIPIYRLTDCMLLSCGSKASRASQRDLKYKVAKTANTHAHIPNVLPWSQVESVLQNQTQGTFYRWRDTWFVEKRYKEKDKLSTKALKFMWLSSR